MARILGLDFGEKRCGLSTTDTLQIAVHPLVGVARDGLMHFLIEYLSQEEVERLVIGFPQHSDGTPTKLKLQIDKFLSEFSKLFPDVIVSFQDESFTSIEASMILAKTNKKKVRKDKTKLDVLSAVLILQRYLNHI